MNDSYPRKLLIIGSVWPEPTSSAAGQRMLQLVDCFQQEGWEITFASAAAKGERAIDFDSTEVRTYALKLNDSSADHFLNELSPDVVLFDRFITEEQFGWRVAEQCPQALRILDTEDLHCLRRSRKKALGEGRSFIPQDLLRDETARREIASIFRSDLSLIISEYEYQLLVDLFGIDKRLLLYLPFLLKPTEGNTIQSWPSFEERRHFVTIGNFRHQPNWDSVHYLYQAIWSDIRNKLPESHMHVYGAYPSQKAKNLHRPERGFYIEGQVEDGRKAVGRARVLLAPLRFGAGLKGKLTEAMQCGTPSVTTPIGAEGINGNMEWSGMIAEKPEYFAEAAVKLYREKSLWEKAQRHGLKIINKRFNKFQFSNQLMNQIDELRNQLTSHRQQNFVGSMLMHHSAASTKYMARWIEEKKSREE